MSKGYLIAQLDVTDPQQYAPHGAAATALLERVGARAFVRPDTASVVEGTPRRRTAIFEFESLERARAFWESDEYVEAKHFREGAAEPDFILIEGVE